MSEKQDPSKRFFLTAVIIISALLVIAMFGGVILNKLNGDTENYRIAADGSYVICGGEKYIPMSDGSTSEYSTDRLIAENVYIEGGDFLDRFFIYGYIIYGSVKDDSVIYVHTAESADSAAGFYVKEILLNETE